MDNIKLFTSGNVESAQAHVNLHILLKRHVRYAPYLLHVFSSFKIQVEPEWAMSVQSAYPGFSIIGNVFTILLVHRLGKRCLVLLTITFCSISYLLISFIGQFYADAEYASWAKLVLFFRSTLSSSLGIMPIGWILMSEVFPMKSKNPGCSICSAVYFFLSFFMSKFYMDLEQFIGFYNTFVLFGGIGLIGLVYFYFRLPETGNKMIKEIAEHFKLKPI